MGEIRPLSLQPVKDFRRAPTTQVKESNLTGYMEAHEDINQSATSPLTNTNPSTLPNLRHFDWSNAATPRLSIPLIQKYHDYVDLRMRVSIEANVPLTPSVQRVHMEARKAGQALDFNGVAAVAELRRLQEKSLKRQERDERTLVVAKWGPISVHDARFRVAKDDNNRLEAREEEKRRISKVRIEVGFLRRWLRAVRGTARTSLKEMTLGQLMIRVRDEGRAVR
ncbi:hypothetical protein E4U17_000499 [Claviceps sp. LM77 group G4]|nr:hypothetical protein E4U17_000499 [Claviceps sp. LM77 group G4]